MLIYNDDRGNNDCDDDDDDDDINLTNFREGVGVNHAASIYDDDNDDNINLI